MLSKNQIKELDARERSYYYGMIKTTKAPIHLVKAWAQRYRISIQQHLQKQCKR